MTDHPSLAVGLMSGTSLDGIDAALVRLHGPTKVELLGFRSRPFTAEERATIEHSIQATTAREMALLHAGLARWAADLVDELLEQTRTKATQLDFIAFPGQTIWHEPPSVTWQLGEPAVLAERFGVPVVSGFRGRDVAAGGQGAPLVPMADVLLFGASDHPRILLNIGGMANLTFVPRWEEDRGVVAFDTGPGMVVIDRLARLIDPTLPFDRGGQLAEAGRVNQDVLERLLEDDYFRRPPPKSTGRERYDHAYISRLAEALPGPDGVATAVECTAQSILEAIARWLPPVDEVVASGGGTRHPVLWNRLSTLGAAGDHPIRFRKFDDLFFDAQAKEAVSFALLGYLALHGQPGNLPGVTGALGPRVLGSITPG